MTKEAQKMFQILQEVRRFFTDNPDWWPTNDLGVMTAKILDAEHEMRLGYTEPTALDLIAAEKHELEKEAWYNEGAVTGLRLCKELWSQGTISHEQIRESELHYLDELKSVRAKIDNLENKEA